MTGLAGSSLDKGLAEVGVVARVTSLVLAGDMANPIALGLQLALLYHDFVGPGIGPGSRGARSWFAIQESVPPPPRGPFSALEFHESLRGRPPFLIFLPNRDLLLRRHRQKTAMPNPMHPTPAIHPIAIPAICPVLRDADAFFSPCPSCPPSTPSGTFVVVLVSVASVLVSVNVGATGSVVRISAGDDVDDLTAVDDGLVVGLVVGPLVDPVLEDLELENDVGSVTRVVGRETDDSVWLAIAVGIEVLWLDVFVSGGNVIGPVPNSGTARVAVMTE